MGSLTGPALGAALVVLAHCYVQPLMHVGFNILVDVPILQAQVHPDRWLLSLGTLFVLIVYFFPAGIVGAFRKR